MSLRKNVREEILIKRRLDDYNRKSENLKEGSLSLRRRQEVFKVTLTLPVRESKHLKKTSRLRTVRSLRSKRR